MPNRNHVFGNFFMTNDVIKCDIYSDKKFVNMQVYYRRKTTNVICVQNLATANILSGISHYRHKYQTF